MDYNDPADRRLRDEPTKPLSHEEAIIAANLYQAKVLANLFATLQKGAVPSWAALNLNLPDNEKETPPDSLHN